MGGDGGFSIHRQVVDPDSHVARRRYHGRRGGCHEAGPGYDLVMISAKVSWFASLGRLCGGDVRIAAVSFAVNRGGRWSHAVRGLRERAILPSPAEERWLCGIPSSIARPWP